MNVVSDSHFYQDTSIENHVLGGGPMNAWQAHYVLSAPRYYVINANSYLEMYDSILTPQMLILH